MTLVQIIDALGIEWRPWPHPKDPPGTIGQPPGDACLAWDLDSDRPVVFVHRPSGRAWSGDVIDEILHEAAHAICGPDSLKDESALMVLQWAVMENLQGDEYLQARRTFSMYSLDDDGGIYDVGDSDEFLHSKIWKEMTIDALCNGIVADRRGEIVPVWGLGPSKKWTRAHADRLPSLQASAIVV